MRSNEKMQGIHTIIETIEQRLQNTEHIDLFSDFDGVLAPIAPTPEAAEIDPGIAAILAELHTQKKIHIAIVSGRSLKSLVEKVAIPALTFAGNHGLEIHGPRIQWAADIPNEAMHALASFAKDMAELLQPFKGAIVEDKNYSLSIHFRLLPETKVAAFKELFEKTLHTYPRNLLHVTVGKKIFEVLPVKNVNKGTATLKILDYFHGEAWPQKTIPIFLGDDMTDEHAFEALQHHGITIFIGETLRKTKARFWLQNISQVKELLQYLRNRA